MKNEKATFSQVMFSIVLFNFGSSVVIGITGGVEQDGWFTILLASLLVIPLFLVYGRIIRLFPQKDLFQVLELIFGKIAGKVLTVLYIWYAVYLSALVLRDFSEFIHVSTMPETPQLPILILMVLTTVYLVRSSMSSIGKWSLVMSAFVLAMVALTFVASIPDIRLENFMPVLSHTPAKIARSTFEVFSFPYTETVIFLGLAGSFQKKANPYKMFLYSLIITTVTFLLVFIRNLSLLGATIMSLNYFPSFSAARIIEVGDFLARIESSISTNFQFAGIVKTACCLLAASKGMASLFDLDHCRPIVLPMAMLALALGAIAYKNTMDMIAFLAYYPYYAFPFQVAIPLAVWVGGEIYAKKHKHRELST